MRRDFQKQRKPQSAFLPSPEFLKTNLPSHQLLLIWSVNHENKQNFSLSYCTDKNKHNLPGTKVGDNYYYHRTIRAWQTGEINFIYVWELAGDKMVLSVIESSCKDTFNPSYDTLSIAQIAVYVCISFMVLYNDYDGRIKQKCVRICKMFYLYIKMHSVWYV